METQHVELKHSTDAKNWRKKKKVAECFHLYHFLIPFLCFWQINYQEVYVSSGSDSSSNRRHICVCVCPTMKSGCYLLTKSQRLLSLSPNIRKRALSTGYIPASSQFPHIIGIRQNGLQPYTPCLYFIYPFRVWRYHCACTYFSKLYLLCPR